MKGRVLGSDKLLRRIRTIQAGLPQLVTRERMGDFLVKRIKARFLAETDPHGEKWKELSPSTRKGRSILRQTSALYDAIDVVDGRNGSMRSATGAGFYIGVKSSPYMVYRPRSGTLEEQDPAKYGRFHQFGIGVKRRQFLGISDLDVKAVDSLLRREIKKLMGT